MMPTIIDSLVVKLGLDSKDLDSKSTTAGKKLKDLEGQSAKTEKGVKQIGETSKGASRGVETLTRTLGSFLAIIGGTAALKAFVEDTIATNAALDRLSKNLNVSVSDLSAWGNAVEGMGGSAKGAYGTLDMLSKAQTELRLTGQSSLIPYFSALGVSLATVEGQARPVDDILLDLSERFSHMDRTTANNMGRMMGIDQDTLNLLLQGRREVELTIKRQKEHNAVTKAQAEESSKLQRSIVDLKQSFTAFGRDLLQQASPAIEKILGLLQSFGSWVTTNKEFIGDFLTVMAVGLGAIALVTLPITGTVAAVTALAAAIALLYQDYQTWKRGGDSFVDWQVWKDRIDAVTNSIHKLRDALGGVADKTETYLEKNVPGFKKFNDWFVSKGDAKKLGAATSGAIGSALGVRSSDPRKAQAERVSAKTGIPADIIYAQWEHETNNFTNRGAKDLNNLAGVNVPGGKGQDYRKFKSLDEFGDYYAYMMRPGGYYPDASKAKTAADFAAALKHGKGGLQYYKGPEDAYATNMQRYLNGIGGASGAVAAAGSSPASSSSTTDKSVKVQTGDITIHTQATDANGIARGMGNAMDYLFTSQANSGLF
jgi:hypothetical protein